jgi:hypothetical protein
MIFPVKPAGPYTTLAAGAGITGGTGGVNGTGGITGGSATDLFMVNNATAGVLHFAVVDGIAPTPAAPTPTQPSLAAGAGVMIPPNATILVQQPRAVNSPYPVYVADGVLTVQPVTIVNPL